MVVGVVVIGQRKIRSDGGRKWEELRLMSDSAEVVGNNFFLYAA